MSTLQAVHTTSETIQFTHRQDNAPLMARIHALKQQGGNGWSKDRTMQHVGSVPALEYVKMCAINPELKDPNALAKWLDSWHGAAYRIAEHGRHKCSQIIIK